MKIALLVFADFERNFWGRPSLLRERFGPGTVIEQTLACCDNVDGVDAKVLVVQPSQQQAAAAFCVGAGWQVWPHDDGVRPHRALLSSARKWNLASWRGGLSNATWYDEFVEPALVLAVAKSVGADAALCVDAHQPLLDPHLCSAMVGRLRASDPPVKFVFTAAPPGLCGPVLHRSALEELASARLPFGALVTYRPEFPMTDPLIHATCFAVPSLVARTKARFVADSRRQLSLLRALRERAGEAASAVTICAAYPEAAPRIHVDLPGEIELELTTATSLSHSMMRPPRVPQRELTDMSALDRLLKEFGQREDARLILCGHGDPLLHPHLDRAMEAARDANLFGIAVESNLLDVPQATLDALLQHRVDVLLARLDATTAATYSRIHGADRLSDAIAAIEYIEQRRRALAQPQPLLAPVFTKCAANLHELDSFFDSWIRRCGSAVIRGYNDYCATLAPDSLLHAAPPVRGPCRRLNSRLALLADGTVAWCGQAFSGEHSLGDWRHQPLRELWCGEPLRRLRQTHLSGEWNNLPLCSACREWFRP